jgi:periplasmic divalent cation tolerance protein
MASFQGTLKLMSNNRDPQELSEYCEDLDVWGFYMEHARTPAASVVSRYQSRQAAKEAGDWALSSAVAACFHVRPIESSYVWQGSVSEAKEWELDLITAPNRAQELFEGLLKRHPYKLPHVSITVIEVSEDYARWVSECVFRDV